jgi:hypothetical protein
MVVEGLDDALTVVGSTDAPAEVSFCLPVGAVAGEEGYIVWEGCKLVDGLNDALTVVGLTDVSAEIEFE